MKKPNAIIVLEFLLQGGIVAIDGHRWCMLENGEVGIVAFHERGGVMTEVGLPNDCTLNYFLKLTERMTDDEVLRCMRIPM